ncbi:MAG: polysaccharide biosynthesis tyrosine autokinase [Myxococcales bacterium]|nr:polysaccharide biosynthesis tyrosine autokinase [Myxococcales bacterium]
MLGVGQELSGGAGADYYKQQQEKLGSYMMVRLTVESRGLHLKLLSEQERANRKLEEQYDLATRKLREELTVRYPQQNRTMYVTVRNENAQLAADIANEHCKQFEDYSRGSLQGDSKKQSEALAGEFATVETRLRDAEAALFQYQKDNDLLAVSLEDRQSTVSANIAAYSQKVNEARAKRIELSAKLDRMKKAAQLDVLESPLLTISDVSSFDSLRAQYYTERNKFMEMGTDFGPKNAEYQKQKGKVDGLLDALRAETRRQLAGVEEQYLAALTTERALSAEIERYRKEAFDLGPKIVAFNELARKKKGYEDKYSILVARLSTTEMNGRMNDRIDNANVRRLDPALVPSDPVSPKLQVNVMVAGTLSLLVGVGLVLLLTFFDRSVKSAEDAQQAAGVPVLGVIPMLAESDLGSNDDRARDLFVHQHPTSRTAECCRSLRTNIMFSAADRQLKTLVVSSANPREGKTTSVFYLGTTMAQSGQRVLLIDTDMRRPRLHTSVRVPRQKGLSNLILGEDNYDDVIKTTEIPNLFVLPCGPLPPNPAELLMTKRFEVVLGELGKRFDRVILDSPPLQAVTDAVVLSKLADGVIIVVRASKTLREEVKRSARQIRDVKGAIFGVILNEFDITQRGSYYYSYYGYGEKQDEAQAPA